MQFDGSTQYGTGSDNDGIDFARKDFTVEVAFKISGGSGTRVLLSKWVSSVGWRIQINSSSALQIRFNAKTYTVSTSVNDGEWHFLRMSVDRTAGLIFFFIDGTLDGRLDISGEVSVSNAANLYLGWDGSSSYWNGDIAEIRLSDRVRGTGAYTRDSFQFPDDYWTKALYHFNEGQKMGNVAYDMSTVRNNIALVSEPEYIAGPLKVAPPIIVYEQMWLAIDLYSDLTTFLAARAKSASSCKYRFRPGDRIPGEWTATNTPALVIAPVALPDIESETTAFHKLMIPLEIRGHLFHKGMYEIMLFWWAVDAALWDMYDRLSTAGRFNHARIQHMECRGPSFEVQELEEGSLMSRFNATYLFEYRWDFLSGG